MLMFNPVNVKQIVMCSDKELTIWTLSETVMKRLTLLVQHFFVLQIQ